MPLACLLSFQTRKYEVIMRKGRTRRRRIKTFLLKMCSHQAKAKAKAIYSFNQIYCHLGCLHTEQK